MKKVDTTGKGSVEVLSERLDRMAELLPDLGKHPRQLSKAGPKTTSRAKETGLSKSKKFQKNDAIIRSYGELNLPEHAELQKWVEGYQ